MQLIIKVYCVVVSTYIHLTHIQTLKEGWGCNDFNYYAVNFVFNLSVGMATTGFLYFKIILETREDQKNLSVSFSSKLSKTDYSPFWSSLLDFKKTKQSKTLKQRHTNLRGTDSQTK